MILPILCEGQYKIENVPNIADVFYMQDVLGVLGITSNLEGKTLEIVSLMIFPLKLHMKLCKK